MKVKVGMEARWAGMQAELAPLSLQWSGVLAAELFANTAEFLFEKCGHPLARPGPTFYKVAEAVDALVQPGNFGIVSMNHILGEVWEHGDAYKAWAVEAKRMAA